MSDFSLKVMLLHHHTKLGSVLLLHHLYEFFVLYYYSITGPLQVSLQTC